MEYDNRVDGRKECFPSAHRSRYCSTVWWSGRAWRAAHARARLSDLLIRIVLIAFTLLGADIGKARTMAMIRLVRACIAPRCSFGTIA